MRIFAGVRWRGVSSGPSGVVENHDFRFFRSLGPMSSELSHTVPQLLYYNYVVPWWLFNDIEIDNLEPP